MNKTIWILLLFALFAIQLLIPGYLIYQQEETLKIGTPYKFKTQPIDPSDPFRGKYITLDYTLNSFETNEDGWEDYYGMAYVYLKEDTLGFAKVKTVSKTPLAIDYDYVVAKSNYNYNCTIYFDLPFDRFYMNENKAYDAEISVRKAQQDNSKTCYGLVYLKDGVGVLKEVYIEDIPLKEYVEQFQKEIDNN